jgi:hypothetical protein
LQLPFVLRAIKRVPRDDPEVSCRMRNKTETRFIFVRLDINALSKCSVCSTLVTCCVALQVAQHVAEILACTARLSAEQQRQLPA